MEITKICLIEMDYERKVQFAIKLLQNIPTDEGPIEISYSTGKDSDVILELAKMAGVPYEAIYKQTSIDPPGSTAHAKEVGARIIRPKQTMLQIIEAHGWPTRRARFCCSILKEYPVRSRAVLGIRRDESTARKERYKEPTACRIYDKKSNAVEQYFPILEWTSEDVARFVAERGIQCHPLYYDEEGIFHPERRLGCIGCPLKSDNGKSDFLQYPKMLKAWIKAGKKYLDTHPNVRANEKFETACNLAYHNLFCDSYEDYCLKVVYEPLFPEHKLDTKKYLEEYFNIDLSDL